MSLSDAFVRAGVVSRERADEVEAQKTKVEGASKEKAKKIQPHDGPEISLTNEEYERCEKLWKGEKSKGFMKHLVWAFVPHDTVDKVWGGEESEENLDKECCLCRRKIITVKEFIEIVGDAAGENMLRQLRFETANRERLGTEEFKKKYAEFLNNMREEMLGKKKLGWKSPESTKVICFPCYQVFHNWVVDRLLRGDKTINGIISVKGKEGRK